MGKGGHKELYFCRAQQGMPSNLTNYYPNWLARKAKKPMSATSGANECKYQTTFRVAVKQNTEEI